MVDDLLDVTRISQGKLRVLSSPLELSRVLHASVNATHARFQEKNIALSLEVPHPTGPGAVQGLWVEGDAVRLEQVFVNLLNNALKFSPPGSRVTLSAARHWLENGSNGNEVRVRVRDQGIGLSPLEASQVFELFAQVAPTSSQAQEGLGIGLYLVQQIVELHGGRMGVSSTGPGQGCEFTVFLPMAERSLQTLELPDPAIQAPALPSAQGALLEAGGVLLEHATASGVGDPTPGVAPPKPAGARARIVLVDDYEPARKAIAKLIRLMGFEVDTAYDGVNALEVAQAFEPDLMLIDINMPRMNGYEVARALRSQPRFARSKLVALTGYGQPEDVRQALEAGFDLHIVKPLDAAALERLLIEQLTRA